MSAEIKVLNRLRAGLLERIQRIEARQRRAVKKKSWATAAVLDGEKSGVQWSIHDLDDQIQECRSGLVLR